MSLPKYVKLVEVGPRDGLQNEKQIIPTEIKLQLIDLLLQAGIKHIEASSFVSSKWVPQMADHNEIMQALVNRSDAYFSALVPNLKGFAAAKAIGVREIAVFTAASNAFTQKNTNCSMDESLKHISDITQQAQTHNIKVRGYISCIAGCPYQGDVAVSDVAKIAKQLYDLGCYEISLGDTIGVGTPEKIRHVFSEVATIVSLDRLAAHFHDTYGQALANIYAVLQLGIHVIDSSISGLGGCPYAAGASGNVATEDVIYLLNGLNITTNISLEKLLTAGRFIDHYLQRQTTSKVSNSLRDVE